MVLQDVNEFSLVLWLHQVCQCACWQSLESFVCGSKDCELSCRAQSVGQACGDDSRHQSAQIWNMLCQLHNVWTPGLELRHGRICGRRKQDTVNDVNHAIACLVVGLDNILEILGVRTNANFAAPSCYVQGLTFHSLDILSRLQLGRQHFLWKNMVLQDVNEFSLVLWLHQVCQCACWQSLESFVCGSKDCELSCRAQSVGQACGDDSRHQSAQIWNMLCQLHYVLLCCSWNHQHPTGSGKRKMGVRSIMQMAFTLG